MVLGMKEWNVGLIDSIFNEEEALLIKCLPLVANDQHDCLVWGVNAPVYILSKVVTGCCFL